jgi:hypothetical protein
VDQRSTNFVAQDFKSCAAALLLRRNSNPARLRGYAAAQILHGSTIPKRHRDYKFYVALFFAKEHFASTIN